MSRPFKKNVSHNYPIKSALMSPLSSCPEASPHSVCRAKSRQRSVWLEWQRESRLKLFVCHSVGSQDSADHRVICSYVVFVCDRAGGMLAQGGTHGFLSLSPEGYFMRKNTRLWGLFLLFLLCYRSCFVACRANRSQQCLTETLLCFLGFNKRDSETLAIRRAIS